MTISVTKTGDSYGDAEYTIERNGQVLALVAWHASKGKIEIQFPEFATVEPHTVVLAPAYAGVESRDPEVVGAT